MFSQNCLKCFPQHASLDCHKSFADNSTNLEDKIHTFCYTYSTRALVSLTKNTCLGCLAHKIKLAFKYVTVNILITFWTLSNQITYERPQHDCPLSLKKDGLKSEECQTHFGYIILIKNNL